MVDEFRLVTEHVGELEAMIAAHIIVLCEQIVDSNLSIYTLQTADAGIDLMSTLQK